MVNEHPVKVAVIGAGRIGRLHAEHLAFSVPSAKLTAVADVDGQAAAACAQKLGVAHWCDDYKRLLADNEIDAVVICSSTDTHARIIEEAAQAGKHIFCEKPIDHELSKIDRALAAVQKAGVKLQIGFNRRFDPNFRALKHSITSGAIGNLQILRITSRDPAPPPLEYIKVSGGLFLDMTIHDFDMARHLVGSEVKRVFAVGAVQVDPAIGKAGDIDTAVITLEFENGVLCSIDNSRQAVYGYDQRLEAFGSAGCVSAENNTATRTVLANAQGVHTPLPLNFFMQRYIESYLSEMREFIDCILHGTAAPVSGEDGRVPVVIALAAKLSLKENRPVELHEVEQTAIKSK